MSLKDLALLGAEDHTLSWPVWQAFWKELTTKSGGSGNHFRPPILFAVDSIDHWMGPTRYRASDFSYIHAHQFILIRQYLSHLFSSPTNTKETFPNGALLLAATTGSNAPSYPSFKVLLRQLQAQSEGLKMTDPNFPMPEPYGNTDKHVLDLFKDSQGTQVTELKGMGKKESRGLLEYFAKSGILKSSVTDKLVGEKWGLSSGGNIGELTKVGKRMTLEP